MVGLPVFDFICKDQIDEGTGEVYKALTCINDETMAERCKVKDAIKAVWSVKADPKFNNDACIAFRAGMQNGKISLLINEFDADEILEKQFKGYDKLSLEEKTQLQSAYLQTTMLQYELTQLGYTVVSQNIKVQEKSGMRKDRYSSVSYSYYLAQQLEINRTPKQKDSNKFIDKMNIRPARYLRHQDSIGMW